MKVVIPVAGLGKRLRPLTFTLPKALIQVAGKPVLSHILGGISRVNPDEIIIVASPWGALDIKRFADSQTRIPVRVVLQEEPKGLGDAVLRARESVSPEEPLLILLGDTILDFDISPFLKEKSDFLGVYRVEDPRRFGIALLDDGGNVLELEEKPENPKSNIALVGLYGIKRAGDLFGSLENIKTKGIKTKGEIQLTDALQEMIRTGWKPKALFVEGWHDCGKLETLLQSNRELLSKGGTTAGRYPNSRLIDPVHIAQDVKIVNSTIGPFVSIGEGSRIEESQIENSILHNSVKVTSSELFDSLIGNEVEVLGFSGKIISGDLAKVLGRLPSL